MNTSAQPTAPVVTGETAAPVVPVEAVAAIEPPPPTDTVVLDPQAPPLTDDANASADSDSDKTDAPDTPEIPSEPSSEAPAGNLPESTPLIEETQPPVDTAAPAVIANPVVDASVPTIPPTTTGDADVDEEREYIDKMRVDGTQTQKRILAAVETFVGCMRPKSAIPPEKGVGFQFEFFQHLMWLLDKDYNEFKGAWNLLLVYFSVYHGQNTPASYSALSEYSTNRFLFAWTKGGEKANAYVNLITLLRATRNRATRKHDIKTILLEKVGPGVISQTGLDNLKQFYAV